MGETHRGSPSPPQSVAAGDVVAAPAPGGGPRKLDWRLYGGLSVTFVYLALMAAYIATQVGWMDFMRLSAERMGGFLEGAFAPLAFMWLVIGYFLQKKELSRNTGAMRMQFGEIQRFAEQAVAQTGAMARTELHQRRESFLKIAELVSMQLGTVVGLLFLSSQVGDGEMTSARRAELWSRVSQRDPDVFSRELLRLLSISSERYCYKLLFGTEIRTRHTENFERAFERLLKAARGCDEDGMIEDALRGGAHGNLYRRIAQVRERIPEGFALGVYDFDPDSRD